MKFKQIFSLSSLSFLGYAIGFINQTIIAREFGTSRELDGYLLALSVVNFGWNFIGPINEISIPDFFKNFKSSKYEGSVYFSKILNLVILLSVFTSSCIYFSLKELFNFSSSGYDNYYEFRELVIMLLPIILLTSVSQFFQVVLNSLSKYIAQSIGKIVTSFISVVLLLLLMDFCGLRAVVLGLEFGLVVLILLQYIIITKSRISYFPRAGFILDNSFYRNTIWLSLTYLITAIQLVYEKFVFLSFGNGVLSSYNYSQALFQIPQMIIVSGVLAIVSTNFMKNILDDEINSGLDNLYKIAFNSFIISAFVAVSISIFSEEIVFILFFRGKFNYNSFIQTVSILRILIFAFPLLVIGSVLGRALVALKKFNQLTIINLFNSIFLIISLYISYLFQNLIFCVSTIIFIHFVIVCYKLKIYESLYISEINSRKKGTVNIMIGFLLIVLFAAFLLWIKSYFINIFSISQISLILESISALTILVVFVFFYFKLIESNEKN